MNLEITGRVQKIFDIQNGVSKSSKEWSKREFLVEEEGKYPKQVCFSLFNDTIDLIDEISVGDLVKVLFSVESREYNGKFYHNVNAYGVYKVEINEQQPKDEEVSEEDSSGGDLPF